MSVAAGGVHSLALKDDGTVWAWGFNDTGQLGDGTTTDRNTPVQVSALSDIAAIAAGYDHSLALKSDGTVWAWGYNYDGQLGDGTTYNRNIPVQVLFATQTDNVCEIDGGAQYATLDEALAAVQEGQTIRLLADINYNSGIVVNEKSFTLDLNGFILTVTSASSAGLEVTDGGVNLAGSGEFNVSGSFYG